ncbi:hypothetical protein NSK_008027 [Nannochloropsis salina CCMP1776]|uniref:Proteasome subunit beta n=1 Tax=Nannochloropsis salina CCMP1776 TaxID=1027361 RepID=A0A4D9CN71_9STRA|nr:hypothetical protein NSK_008027 [Nannochloropsis salina CCMP1776]|eukprot:TFJ80601.1 hypothetical protein NSK_008027 [Nannochloropsis salina CCMP1776]
MSILEYNGGAVVAMVGKNCVAIASDLRYGVQAQTVACNFPKVHKMSDRLFVGLSGLATDIQTLEQLLRFRLNLYKLREERDIKPETFSALLSHILYEKRFGPYFVEPLVAGLRAEDNTPFISGMDLIGAPVFAKDFVVAGTCAANLYGLCESFFKPDLEPEQLFEVLSQSLLASVDRDALSGWGAVVHVITPDGVTSRTLKARQD